MASQTKRRVTFVVNDDEKTFITVIPEEIIEEEELRNVARNFRYMTDEDCYILYDSQAKAYRLVQIMDNKNFDPHRFSIAGHAKGVEITTPEITTPETSDHAASQASKQPTRIPRPPNAWILYRSQKSREIRKKLPHVTAGYISTVVSRMWKLESRDTRLQYNSKALEVQKLHKEMYPDYKYNACCKKTK